MPINWSKGFSARYYATVVNPKTWRDISTIDISEGSIQLTNSSLRESASISCRQFDSDSEQWIRIYLDARQSGGGAELVPIFTGLTSVPDQNYNGRKRSDSIQCYSVLKPAEDVYLPIGYYIQAGINGAVAVKDLLDSVTSAPVTIDGESEALSQTLVAEMDESHLSMADYILQTIGWRLRIGGDGSIVICDRSSKSSASFNADTYDVVELDVSIKNNWYDCPNVFRAINDDMTAIAKDNNPDSRFSIQNRGREIWRSESGCSLNEGESLAQYANRRLKEEQQVGYSLEYGRRFHPDVRPTDLVSIYYPEQKVNGMFEVESQTITLGYGCSVSETSTGVF